MVRYELAIWGMDSWPDGAALLGSPVSTEDYDDLKEARGRGAQYTGFVWFGATILALEKNFFA